MGDAHPVLVWALLYLWDLGRYLLVAGPAFGFFWVWRRAAFADRRIQPRAPKPAQMRAEVKHSLVTALVFSIVGVGVYYGKAAGILRVYPDVAERGWAWLFASVALLVVMQDAYFYWTHRAMHHPRLFSWTHGVHHRSVSPSPWTAYSFAPAEALVHALFVPLALLVVPVHEVAVFAFLSYMIVRNVLGHLGLELAPAWFLRSAIGRAHTTTTHHDLHHRHARANFGLYFTWWDRWMGTEHARYHQELERVVGAPLGAEPAAAPCRVAV